jgi:hypothetical protein
MVKKLIKTFFISTGIVLILAILFISCRATDIKVVSDLVPGSCTIFSASIGDKVLFGNNEDYNNPNTYYWTEPASDDNYGCLYLGFENDALQGGINEKGLCFDANSLPGSSLNPHYELPLPPFAEPPYEKFTIWAPVTILRKAATVEEAIEIASKYQRQNWDRKTSILKYQINFADAKGDAVIISAGKDRELVFTTKKLGEKYILSTNFNIANPKDAWVYPCWRYNKAAGMLNKIQDENNLTIDYFKSILDSVHLEQANSHTLYSNIFDLRKGIIYLYYWHQYDEVAVLNVAEEIAKGKISVRLENLFSKETVDKALAEYKGYQKR